MTKSFCADGSASSQRSFVVAGASGGAATTPGALALPSTKHGSQAYFWTADWQQKERLADFDILIGDVYVPKNIDDLLRELDEPDAGTEG